MKEFTYIEPQMDEEFVYVQPTMLHVLRDCVGPSMDDVLYKILTFMAYNVMFSLLTQTVVIAEFQFHFVSSILGIALMYNIVEANITQFLVSLVLAHGVIRIFQILRFRLKLEYLIGGMCVSYILMCECFHPIEEEWLASRGMYMIASMKMISLGPVLQSNRRNVSLLSFLGYMCCPANSIFGPWFTYGEYISIRRWSLKKDFSWVLYIFRALYISMSFLSISNCWASYFVAEDNYKWIVAYSKALSFRASHYFISYLSEAGMIAAGYVNTRSNKWSYEVTKFSEIEMPHSLVNVVTTWNIPMHRFLKKHVYNPSLRFGRFQAIFITFLASSLLHGLNISLAAVLLTIGVYSYIQLKFQEKVAEQFNACLGVRPCKTCRHRFKRNNWFVRLALLLFSGLTVFSLIFLGVLMDFSDNDNGVYVKWRNLDFMGHWVMLVIYLYTYLSTHLKL